MLIAIMSDTFEKVIEQRPTYSLKNKLMILADMESVINAKEEDDDSKIFLYVIMPLKSEDEEEGIDSSSDNWRGRTFYTINLIKKLFASTDEQVQQIASEQRNSMNLQSQTIQEQIVKQNKTMN